MLITLFININIIYNNNANVINNINNIKSNIYILFILISANINNEYSN